MSIFPVRYLLFTGLLVLNMIYSTSIFAEKSAEKQKNEWITPPHPKFQNIDLQGKNRKITLKITRDQQGYIHTIKILQSTGIKSLDEKLIGQIKDARLNPKTTPINTKSSLFLELNNAQKQAENVLLNTNSSTEDIQKIWQYFPVLKFNNQDLNDQNRNITLFLDINKNGHVKEIKILQSSGLETLDRKIADQLRSARVYKYHAPIQLTIPLSLDVKKDSN